MSDTLLIVEDEQLLGSELVRHYEGASWEIVWARTFREARRYLLDEQLDPIVVLSDINLPDGNGLDLLDEVRQRGGRGEWVFLTGYGEVPDSVRAIRLGAYDFLTKPWRRAQRERTAPPEGRERESLATLYTGVICRPQPSGVHRPGNAGTAYAGTFQRADHHRGNRNR